MLQTLIVPGKRDLGDGFQVRCALPVRERKMVGPFIFFDQMGPVKLPPGKGLDVRPHPHIGRRIRRLMLFGGEPFASARHIW